MLITDLDKLKKYETDRRVWQGIPGIVCTKGGRVFVSFYSGNVRETYGNFAVLIESRDGGVTFGEPIAVAEKAGNFRCFDPVVWIDPIGRLWFIWNVMPGEEVMGAICDDPDAEELVWSEPFFIGRGIMMNKPTVLSTGEWLFPIAVWRLDLFPEYRRSAYREDEIAGSYVYKTSDLGRSFVCLGMSDLRDRSYDEHMVVELQSGMLRMLVRTNYGIGMCDSYDRGKTWSSGSNSGIGGPCSRFFITRLRSGRLLLINHYRYTKRDHLTVLLSEDDGRTFPYTLLIDERANVSYPDAMEGEDGYLYITYDRERGAFKSSMEEVYASEREILTARITEEDILCGEVKSEGSYLKNVASKLGRLAEDMPDPFAGRAAGDRDLARRLLSEGGDVLERVFVAYPVNCINVCDFDAERLDRLIERFRATGERDEDALVDIIDHIRRAPSKKKSLIPVIEEIKSYIAAHLCEDLSLNSLAAYMHISVHYLAHLFKSVTGTTVVAYRNELRLTQAKHLLVETACTVGEIAERTGFSSAAYFTEIFTRSERIPPTEYRKYHGKRERV